MTIQAESCQFFFKDLEKQRKKLENWGKSGIHKPHHPLKKESILTELESLPALEHYLTYMVFIPVAKGFTSG